MSGVTEALVKGVVDNKLYLGTPKSKYFPKVTEKYILGEKNWQIVIDPVKIAESLKKAKKTVEEAKKNSKSILVILDKEVFSEDVEALCEKVGVMYLNTKVPGGFFTNFDTFFKRIHSMNELRKFIESEDFLKLTKKEQLVKKAELKKIENIYKGVKKLEKLPDLVIVIDAEYYSDTIDELEKMKIDYIAVANTNLSKWLKTDNLIVSNTNSYKSVLYLLTYLLN